jgi:hypothetical protein
LTVLNRTNCRRGSFSASILLHYSYLLKPWVCLRDAHGGQTCSGGAPLRPSSAPIRSAPIDCRCAPVVSALIELSVPEPVPYGLGAQVCGFPNPGDRSNTISKCSRNRHRSSSLPSSYSCSQPLAAEAPVRRARLQSRHQLLQCFPSRRPSPLPLTTRSSRRTGRSRSPSPTSPESRSRRRYG